MNFETLSRWAEEELEALLKVLPADVRDAAREVPVSMEEKPGNGAFDDELQGDELGLFERQLNLGAQPPGERGLEEQEVAARGRLTQCEIVRAGAQFVERRRETRRGRGHLVLGKPRRSAVRGVREGPGEALGRVGQVIPGG